MRPGPVADRAGVEHLGAERGVEQSGLAEEPFGVDDGDIVPAMLSVEVLEEVGEPPGAASLEGGVEVFGGDGVPIAGGALVEQRLEAGDFGRLALVPGGGHEIW